MIFINSSNWFIIKKDNKTEYVNHGFNLSNNRYKINEHLQIFLHAISTDFNDSFQ